MTPSAGSRLPHARPTSSSGRSWRIWSISSGGIGGSRTPSPQSLMAWKAVGGLPRRHHREVRAEQEAVGHLVLDGGPEAVVELPPAVEARREVGEDVLVLAHQHHRLLHHRLPEMRDDHPQAGERPADPVQEQGVAPLERRLRVVGAAHVEHDRHAERVGHLVEAPGRRAPGIEPVVDGRELQAAEAERRDAPLELARRRPRRSGRPPRSPPPAPGTARRTPR